MKASIKNIVLPDAPEPTRPIRDDRFEGYGKMIYERQIPTTAMELMIPPTRSNSKAAEAEREIKTILDLAREGKTASEICKATGFNHNRVVQVVKRFAEHGAQNWHPNQRNRSKAQGHTRQHISTLDKNGPMIRFSRS
ncbi:MAG: helix-turn-helix domain-containing protein [Prevotella sp.]|nr:helix-turn-helix domain-containing protein [Prevotella sp.]